MGHAFYPDKHTLVPSQTAMLCIADMCHLFRELNVTAPKLDLDLKASHPAQKNTKKCF